MKKIKNIALILIVLIMMASVIACENNDGIQNLNSTQMSEETVKAMFLEAKSSLIQHLGGDDEDIGDFAFFGDSRNADAERGKNDNWLTGFSVKYEQGDFQIGIVGDYESLWLYVVPWQIDESIYPECLVKMDYYKPGEYQLSVNDTDDILAYWPTYGIEGAVSITKALASEDNIKKIQRAENPVFDIPAGYKNVQVWVNAKSDNTLEDGEELPIIFH